MTEPGKLSGRRRFNGRERTALYLAADGKCSECGRELEPGWHADHETPWSRGGKTDVINGQALCSACNLKKGYSMNGQRQWQHDATDKFYALNRRDFLVSATPGAGKTRFSLELARQLLESGTVRRVAVVVPSDSLRQQWADAAAAAGISLMPVSDETDYDKSGYAGFVATYAQLARGAGSDLVRRATRNPTMAILDEIHHAGDSRAWGDGLAYAMEHATFRIALTGTPWRQDQNQIPFVRYGDDGKVVVDHAYEYGQAVADGVCRTIEFHAYDGEARWRDCGEAREARLGANLPDDDVPAVLESVLHPDYEWIPGLLARAAADLDELRKDVPNAGGLVVAHEQWQARAYARRLKEITGEQPTLALSDDPEAKSNIDAFRSSTSGWLVAVKMVSEGVDIPRLAVGVYASKTRTPLFFRQVVGRFVRVRPDEEFNARLFIPAIPTLMRHAREIEEELRHQLEIERQQDETTRERADGQFEMPLREPIGATEAIFDRAIYKGGDITTEEHSRAEDHCRRHGIPLNLAANVARLLREQSIEELPTPAQAAKPDANIPRHRHEKMLRDDINTLAGKVAYRTDMGKRDINTTLLQAGFPTRSKASVEQLTQIRDYLAHWLGELA